jgi:hypothetical protein
VNPHPQRSAWPACWFRRAWQEAFAYRHCGVHRGHADNLRERAEVVFVAAAGGERLHGEDVFRRRCHDANAGVVEHLAPAVIPLRGDVCAGLFVQPPRWQTHRLGDVTCLVEDDAVWHEGGVDVAGHPVGVIGERHRRTADNEHVGDHPSSDQPVAQCGEGPLKLGAAEKPVRGHAASRSRAER